MEELRKKPRVKISVVVIIVLFTIIGFFLGFNYKERMIEQERVIPDVTRELPLPRHLENLVVKTGHEEPQKLIIEDLVSRPELITHDPVLGGSMGFYNRDEIFLLSDRWVLAAFEDGHIGGYLLLEFEIRDDEQIEWLVLDSFIE